MDNTVCAFFAAEQGTAAGKKYKNFLQSAPKKNRMYLEHFSLLYAAHLKLFEEVII